MSVWRLRATANATISACGRRTQWERALAVLWQLKQTPNALDSATYSTVITALGKARRWSLASFLLMYEMPGVEVVPGKSAYNATISACRRGHQWQMAWATLEAMQAATVEPDTVTCAATLGACAEGQRWLEAVSMVADLWRRGPPPDFVTLIEAIGACKYTHQWAHAVAILGCAENAFLSNGGGAGGAIRCYNAVASACGEASIWERVLTTLYQCAAVHQQPDTVGFSFALRACVQNQNWRLAVSIASEMRARRVPFDLACCSAVFDVCTRGLGASQLVRDSLIIGPLRRLMRQFLQAKSVPGRMPPKLVGLAALLQLYGICSIALERTLGRRLISPLNHMPLRKSKLFTEDVFVLDAQSVFGLLEHAHMATLQAKVDRSVITSSYARVFLHGAPLATPILGRNARAAAMQAWLEGELTLPQVASKPADVCIAAAPCKGVVLRFLGEAVCPS